MTESHPEASSRSPRLRPPPNYNSRAVQLRLFLVVAALMGVIILVTEAAKPDNWQALFGGPAVVVENPPPAPVERIDPRLDRLPGMEEKPVADAVRITDPLSGSLNDQLAAKSLDPVSRVQADGWSLFYEGMSSEDRTLVAQAFKQASLKRTLPEPLAGKWTEWLAAGDRFWDQYRAKAERSLQEAETTRTPEEREAWIRVLDRVRERWLLDRGVLAQLAVTGDEPLPDAYAAQLAPIQARWERLALAVVQDDTLHRGVEADAWFRLLDVLSTTPAEDLNRLPVESVSYVQLFKQSALYRGKLIRFRGRIMQARPDRVLSNSYGFKRQFILWVQPEGQNKTPIVVYALEMPAGFPSLEKPNLPGGYTKLREDVEVTGYFFKRWAYEAHDGVNTAPLVLARQPRWFPSDDAAAHQDPLPSASTFALWVTASALFGVVVATVAYLRSKKASPALKQFNTSPAAARELHQSLANAQAGPSVKEMLQALEERDRGNDSAS